jgi:23S rRNA pseudouridine1911/1915/1917 synthase
VKALEFTADAAAAGERLDRFLARRLAREASRTEVQRAIRERGAWLNGRPVREGDRVLAAGDRVRIEWGRPPAKGPPPAEPRALDVLYEDAELLVINKPAGLVVHPGAGRRAGTLANALLGSGRRLSDAGGADRPGIVHRLDKDTSGALLVAKTNAAHRALARAFQARAVRKTYLALVEGRMEHDAGEISLPIGRHPRQRTKMAVRPDGGRDARTGWRVVERFRSSTLLEVRLYTGRTHQIRVHLASVGHPVVGDAAYGRGARYPRTGLHAAVLEFEHPATGRTLRVEAPPPEDFRGMLESERARPGRPDVLS